MTAFDPWSYFRPDTWRLICQWCGFRGNIISGYQHIYIPCFWEPAYGKYFVDTTIADDRIRLLVKEGYLRPMHLSLDPERRLTAGLWLQGNLSTVEPVIGQYVDWAYEVTFDPIECYNERYDFNESILGMAIECVDSGDDSQAYILLSLIS